MDKNPCWIKSIGSHSQSSKKLKKHIDYCNEFKEITKLIPLVHGLSCSTFL
jgi:hypothetical protein